MHTKWRIITCLIFVLILGLGLPIKAYAHGTIIEYKVNMAIEIVAIYDDGQPMAGAEVTIYAPDDPSATWLTGVCDDDGRFSFVPDVSKPGTWVVRVYQLGHGGIVHIPVGEGLVGTGDAGGYTPLRTALTAACVIWGIIGTGLYFSRRRA